MGFPFLHKYVFNDNVLFPISNINKLETVESITTIYFDCTGLLYHLSFGLPTTDILENNSLLLHILKTTIIQYVDIVYTLPKSKKNPINVYLFFDGKPPKQKTPLHFEREEKTKKYIENATANLKELHGLSAIVERFDRGTIICDIADEIKNKLEECDEFTSKVNSCKTFVHDEGEADIKILKKILSKKDQLHHFPAIVSCDTDIFLSLESLRNLKNGVLILIKFPLKGQYCLTSGALNTWIMENNIIYKVLLFYFMFFFGSDFEPNIVSATKKQILDLLRFLHKNNFKVSGKLLLQSWAILKWRCSKSVVVHNLTQQTLCKIVELKKQSVIQNLLYYVHCNDFSDYHPTLFKSYPEWKLLVKNINARHIKTLFPQYIINLT